MKTANSAIIFEETHVGSKEDFLSLDDTKTVESLIDHYDEPSYFFKGAVLGLILCLPFWAVMIWLII